MKVIVLRKFLDKHTGEVHKPGDILEITEERFAEILKVGKLVEKVSEETTEPEVSEEVEETTEPEEVAETAAEPKRRTRRTSK